MNITRREFFTVGAIAAVAAAGCSSKPKIAYTGDLRGLIDFCQSISTDNKETYVEVSAYTFDFSEPDEDVTCVMLYTDNTITEYYASAHFEEPIKGSDIGSRITVRGYVDGGMVASDHVYILDCELA